MFMRPWLFCPMTQNRVLNLVPFLFIQMLRHTQVPEKVMKSGCKQIQKEIRKSGQRDGWVSLCLAPAAGGLPILRSLPHTEC